MYNMNILDNTKPYQYFDSNPIFSRNVDWFFKNSSDKVERYPLTDLSVGEDDILHIDIAIAGFSKDQITIEQSSNKIIVKGSKPADESKRKYIQQCISTNDFSRVLILHENYVDGEVSAEFENGILQIEVKPKKQVTNKIKIK